MEVQRRSRFETLLVLHGATKHLIWASLFFTMNYILPITPLALFKQTRLNPMEMGLLLALCSIIALVGVFMKPVIIRLVCFFPQQILITMTFIAALDAILQARSDEWLWRYILASELPALSAALYHTLGLVWLAMTRRS